MKRHSLFILALVAGVCGLANGATGDPQTRQPQPNTYVSEAVYQSSNTAIVSSFTVVSDNVAILHSVVINTPGAVGSRLEVFNANTSTTSPNAVRIASIDTTSKKTLTYDVFASSGLTIMNSGSVPADITLTFRKK